MAKAKYTKQKNGYFQTRVWDGVYNDDGTKHYIMLRSLLLLLLLHNTKSSALVLVR